MNKTNNWSFATDATGWTATNGAGTDYAGTGSASQTNFTTFARTGAAGNPAGSWEAISTATNNTRHIGKITQSFTAPGSGTVRVRGTFDYFGTSAGWRGANTDGYLRLDIHDNADSAVPVANLAIYQLPGSDEPWTTLGFGADVNLTGGTNYTLRLTIAYRNSGTTPATIRIDNIIANFAPVGLASSPPADTTNAKLDWTASTPGTGAPGLHGTNPYKIYRDGTFLANSSSNTYTDSVSQGNTSYEYYITDADTNSIESPSSAFVTQLTRPGKPTGVSAVDQATGGTVQVSWTNPAGGSDNNYKVYASTNSAGPWDGTTLKESNATSPVNVTGLTDDQLYYFKVRGNNATGDGAVNDGNVTATPTAGGGDTQGPNVSILSPVNNSKWLSGNPSYTITGQASDVGRGDSAISTVEVGIKNPGGQWWNGGSQTWGSEIWNTASPVDGSFNNVTESYSYTWNIPQNVETSGYEINVKARDSANNWTESPTQMTGIKIDTWAPRIGSFSINSSANYVNTTSVTINSSVTDTSAIEMQWDGANWIAYNSAQPASVSSGDGNKSITSYFRENPAVMDPLSNQSSGVDDISLDTTKPVSDNYSPTGSSAPTTANSVSARIIDPVSGGVASGVDGSSLTHSNVYLKRTSDGVTVSTSVSWSSPTVAINHPALAASTSYTAFITGGVKDNINNFHNASSWSFTTAGGGGAPPTAALNVSNAASGPGNVALGTNKKQMQTLTFAASDATATINHMTVAFSGNVTSADLGLIYALDANAGDAVLATASYSGAGNYRLTFNPARNIAAGNNDIYKIAADVKAGATETRTFESNIASKSSISTNVNPSNINTFTDYKSGIFTVQNPPPGPPGDVPTGFIVLAKQNPTTSLSWNSVSGATKYKVERSLDIAGTWDLRNDNVTSTNYDDISGNSLYYYRVYAGNDSGWGPPTNPTKPTVNLNTNIAAGGGTIESSDGTIRITIPAGNSGNWILVETAPPGAAPSGIISKYFDITPPGPTAGTFTISIKTTELGGRRGYNASFWRHDGTNWRFAMAQNINASKAGDGFVVISGQVTGFSGYLLADGVQNAAPPRGPHGDYADTTNKCKDCHAVHLASGPYKLLRAGATNERNACSFCHGTGGIVGSKNGVILNTAGHGLSAAEQALSTVTAKDDVTPAFSVPTERWGCQACHSVHNNNTLPGIANRVMTAGTSNALLKAKPDANKGGLPTTGSAINLSRWCAECHGANYGTYGQSKTVPFGADVTTAYGHDAGSTSGITFQGDGSSTYAYVSTGVTGGMTRAPRCNQCHAAGAGRLNPNGWVSGQLSSQVAFLGTSSIGFEGYFPHTGYSNSYSLLKSSNNLSQANNVRLDDVCNDCHYTPSLP